MTPDWIVKTILDRGPEHYYRYQVTGENLSARDPEDRFFCWSIPEASIHNPRYDLTNAQQVTDVQYADKR